MKNKKRKMTSLEEQIYGSLPVGYSLTNEPAKVKWLASRFGARERDVYKAIENLIFLFDVPIVGLREKPYGYFIAADENEYDNFTASYKQQIKTEQKRLAKIKKNLKKSKKLLTKKKKDSTINL